jgi:hypothetical protein
VSHFVGAAFGFPTALFSVLLLIVIGYWLIVLTGVLGDGGGLDGGGVDGGGLDAGDGLLGVAGLAGVPVTFAVSVMVAVAWFTSLAGAALFPGKLASVAVLVVALAAGWAVTRLVVLGARRFFHHAATPSRRDFLGRPCVIRTGSVTPSFGQAEVTAADGSSAIVQVRQSGADDLRAGNTAYIYGYDDAGEFFWVVEHPDRTRRI